MTYPECLIFGCFLSVHDHNCVAGISPHSLGSRPELARCAASPTPPCSNLPRSWPGHASEARWCRRKNNAVTCSPSSRACRRWPVGLKSAAQRHSGDGGGESQSKRQELTFEFCSALAEMMQLRTDALAQVGTSAASTCHTPHTPENHTRKSTKKQDSKQDFSENTEND